MKQGTANVIHPKLLALSDLILKYVNRSASDEALENKLIRNLTEALGLKPNVMEELAKSQDGAMITKAWLGHDALARWGQGREPITSFGHEEEKEPETFHDVIRRKR